MLEEIVKSVSEESSSSVKLQLLSAVMKLFFKRPPECQEMLGTLLEHSIGERTVLDYTVQHWLIFHCYRWGARHGCSWPRYALLPSPEAWCEGGPEGRLRSSQDGHWGEHCHPQSEPPLATNATRNMELWNEYLISYYSAVSVSRVQFPFSDVWWIILHFYYPGVPIHIRYQA